MAGSKTGVAAQLQAEEPCALLWSCSQSCSGRCYQAIQNALDTAFEEVGWYIFLQNVILLSTESGLKKTVQGESGFNRGICSFCPTRWTLRGDDIESIVKNYDALKTLWKECLEMRLEPEVKGRIIGVQAQMMQYNTLLCLQLSKPILKITDNLSRSLQKQSMSTAEGQELAALTMHVRKYANRGFLYLVFQAG